MSNSNNFRADQHVKWKWGDGYGKGQVAERFENDVTRTLRGSEITKNGDADNPA